MPGYGIGSAATTLVGRSYGAGNYKLAKRYGNICIAMGAVLMAITGGLMMIFCPFVFSILTPDPQVRSFAADVLRIELLAEPFFGASHHPARPARHVDCHGYRALHPRIAAALPPAYIEIL